MNDLVKHIIHYHFAACLHYKKVLTYSTQRQTKTNRFGATKRDRYYNSRPILAPPPLIVMLTPPCPPRRPAGRAGWCTASTLHVENEDSTVDIDFTRTLPSKLISQLINPLYIQATNQSRGLVGGGIDTRVPPVFPNTPCRRTNHVSMVSPCSVVNHQRKPTVGGYPDAVLGPRGKTG